MTFTAIDFETAQGYRWSICQVGLVRVENGVVVREISQLIRPPQNYYWQMMIDIHGIEPHHTESSPSFSEFWPSIQSLIHGQVLVAHNMTFDASCLRATLAHYQLPAPPFEPRCTYRMLGQKLDAACRDRGIPLNHHDALSDARACAQLFLKATTMNN